MTAQAADALTYAFMMLALGPWAEANPLVTHIGPIPAVAGKIALMVGLLALSYYFFDYAEGEDVGNARRIIQVVLLVATVAGTIGCLSNLSTILGAFHYGIASWPWA